MKKLLAFLLTVCLLLPLAACAPASLEKPFDVTEEEQETEKLAPIYTKKPSAEKTNIREEPQGTFDPTGFSVGFGRYEITPPNGTPMNGYGNSSTRLSTEVRDDLYVTCIAVRDEEGTTALFFSVDTLNVPVSSRDKLCADLLAELGIAPEYVFITSTHTHSGGEVGLDSVQGSIFFPRAVKAAKDAIATLDRAEIYVGDTNTVNMAYVRRYKLADGTPIYRDNIPSSGSSPEYQHETDADTQMRLIRFDRANQKDIVMVNWQCHVTTFGGSKVTAISSDWVGSMRSTVEETEGVYFSYHQGAAGNVTPGTRLANEQNNANDHVKHGKDLASFVSAALPGLKKVPTGKIRALESSVTAVYDRNVEGYDLDLAQQINNLFTQGKTSGEIRQLMLQGGYASSYHARTILSKSKYEEGKTANINVGVIAIGDLAFSYAPFEMFDTSGVQIKENSPFEFTFVCAYTNGSFGYIPNKEVFPNNQYEVDTCKFVAGTAEQVVSEITKLLNEVK